MAPKKQAKAEVIRTKPVKVFKPILLLTLLFFIGQLVWLGINFVPIWMDPHAQAFFAQEVIKSTPLVSGIANFFLAQLLVHLLYAILIWLIISFVGKFFRWNKSTTRNMGIVFWFIATIGILAANHYVFPYSIFSFLPELLAGSAPWIATPEKFQTLSLSIGVVCAITLLIALLGFFVTLSKKPGLTTLFIIFLVASGSCLFYYKTQQEANVAAVAEKPNVIIIGINSLRPGVTSHFGSKDQLTPNIDKFLDKATVFRRAITPLGRIYPAWISILTGKNPQQTGAHFNLPNQAELKFKPEDLLSTKFQRAGYETIFTSDYQRYLNIRTRDGFDSIYSPGAGFNDFFLGTLNDLPISNFLNNTLAGRYLFPNSFMNRAVDKLYYPETYVKYLRHKFQQKTPKPLFLVANFSLPHWPYAWAKFPNDTPSSDDSNIQRYKASVNMVDWQVGEFLRLLHKQGELDNAIVVMLSDYGQSFGLPQDIFINKQNYVGDPNKIPQEVLNTIMDPKSAIGNGTNITSIGQFHILLAIRTYGKEANIVKDVNEITSLIDVAPTILEYSNMQAADLAGVSLMPFLQNSGTVDLPQRQLFLENGLSFDWQKLYSEKMDDSIKHGLKYFNIDSSTGFASLKKDLVPKLMLKKQRAVIQAPWMLALIPQADGAEPIKLIINLKTGKWTDQLNSGFANQAPLSDMLQALDVSQD